MRWALVFLLLFVWLALKFVSDAMCDECGQWVDFHYHEARGVPHCPSCSHCPLCDDNIWRPNERVT